MLQHLKGRESKDAYYIGGFVFRVQVFIPSLYEVEVDLHFLRRDLFVFLA